MIKIFETAKLVSNFFEMAYVAQLRPQEEDCRLAGLPLKGKRSFFVAGPRRVRVGSADDPRELEYTIHTCPSRLLAEMVRIFFLIVC